MAEFAKNRTELIQQQLSHLHPKPSIPSSARVSKSQDALSDRDSHCTLPAKLVSKGYSEASGSSVDSNSSKKSKSSREKAKNDDRDRRDRSKSDKSRDRHDSKEKDSRHRHRDKDRHSESKDKEKNRSRDRIRETSSSSKSSGDWKDYNEAKRASPQKRSHKKEPGLGSDDDNVDSDTKLLKRAPSSPIQNNSKIPALMLVKQDEDGMSEENQEHGLSHPAKSPSFNSQAVESSGSECSSPMKRKFSKDKQSDREYSKTPRNEKERISKDKDKTVISDPRLRRRVEREKGVKAEEKNWEQSSSKEACKPTEWNNYRARQQAVLRKSYRKPSGNEHKDEETASTETVTNFSRVKPDLMAGDVDLRAPTFDVDLRTETDGSGPEPPNKKSRGDSRGTFDEYYAFLNAFTYFKIISRYFSECFLISSSDLIKDSMQCTAFTYLLRIWANYDILKTSQENENSYEMTEESPLIVVGRVSSSTTCNIEYYNIGNLARSMFSLGVKMIYNKLFGVQNQSSSKNSYIRRNIPIPRAYY